MAKIADEALVVAHRLADRPRQAVTLGSGLKVEAEFEKHLDRDWKDHRFPFSVFGINVPSIPGQEGSIVLTRFDDVDIVLLLARIHDYHMRGRMMRRLMGTKYTLMAGADREVVYNTVGALNHGCPVGSLILPTKIFGAFMPAKAYLNGAEGEFVTATSVLMRADSEFHRVAIDAARTVGLKLKPDGHYAALSGPNYEDRGDIEFLQSLGVDAAGMSGKPDLEFAAVENKDRMRMAKMLRKGEALRPWDDARFLIKIRPALINVVSNDETDPRPPEDDLAHDDVTDEVAKRAPQIFDFLSILLKSAW